MLANARPCTRPKPPRDEFLAASGQRTESVQGRDRPAVATDLGVDPQTLVDALVEYWSPAIDNALAAGAITQEEAAEYRTALQEAFTFRVNWDGEQQTPTFSGVAS